MADFDSCRRFLNPCLLHLQKMELELKCPVCLNLLSHPLLLPCNHIFCRLCISGKSKFESRCLLCKSPYAQQDLRPIPHMETMVSIYKSMDAAFGAKLFQPTSQVEFCGNVDACDISRREHVHGLHKKNSYNMQKPICYIPPSKRIRASPDFTNTEVETPARPLNSFKLRNDGGGAENVELSTKNGECDSISVKEAFVNDGDPALPSLSSYSDSKCEEQVTDRKDFTQREHELNGGPPSFREIKDSDDDSNDQASKQCGEQLSSKGAFGTGSEGGVNVEGCSTITNSSIAAAEASMKVNIRSSTSPSEVDQTRELKRQKSDCEPHDMSSNAYNSTPSVICAFCQSSKVTQASGSMLHYLNGTAVEADKAIQYNVLHVHKKCAEWAPQVYFAGETVVNLEAELARGAKIKCSSCGKKGAALGCYAKSCRRSFHVPCAAKVPKCRWDFDNFLMLCPAHAYLKLPNERSKARRRMPNMFSGTQLEYERTSGDCPSFGIEKSTINWVDSSKESSEWVVCGSALSSEDKELLSEFSAFTGVRISKTWNANVTHVIASTNEMGACSRTLKFLMAILNGRWILKIDWIKACVEAKHPVCEEPFEISCDIHGSWGGPKNGRIRVMEKAPKLLNGLSFYFSGDFMPSYKGYLQDLVVAAGGVLMRNDMVPCNSTTGTAKTTFVMYNQDPPKASRSTDSPYALEKRRNDAEAIAGETGSQVVGHAWLLDSIAACSLLPISP